MIGRRKNKTEEPKVVVAQTPAQRRRAKKKINRTRSGRR